MLGDKWKGLFKLHWEGGVRSSWRINPVLKYKPRGPTVCRRQVYGRVESRLESVPQKVFAFHFPCLTVLHPNCQCSSVKHRGRKEKSVCKLAVCSPGSCSIISHESWLFLTTVVCQFQNKELCDVSGDVHLACSNSRKLWFLIVRCPTLCWDSTGLLSTSGSPRSVRSFKHITRWWRLLPLCLGYNVFTGNTRSIQDWFCN